MSDERSRICRLPHHFDAAALPDFMAALGVPLPADAGMQLAGGVPLAASGKRFTVAEIDGVLDKTSLSTSDRMAVKVALTNQGLLARA